MPSPLKGESKEDYIGRFMQAEHAQHFPEEQRVAVAEHLWSSHHGEHDKMEHRGNTIHDAEKTTITHESSHVPLQGDVRFEGSGVLRYEAAVSDRKPTIDRTTHTLKGVRIMNAKPTRKDYFYGLEGQQAVVNRYEGMVAGVDHDYKQGPLTLERSIGKVLKAYTDENGTLGDFQLNPAHERYEQILKDAETGLNTISISAICSRCEQHGNEVTSFEPVGVDFVVQAGQTTKLFEQVHGPEATQQAASRLEAARQASSQTGPASPLPEVSAAAALPATPATDTRLEQLTQEVSSLKAKMTRLEQVAPATVAADVARMEQAITARGFDLNKFHDEFLKNGK